MFNYYYSTGTNIIKYKNKLAEIKGNSILKQKLEGQKLTKVFKQLD